MFYRTSALWGRCPKRLTFIDGEPLKAGLLLRGSTVLTFVISGLFNFFSFVKVPVMRLRIPGLGEEFNDIWGGHLSNGFPGERAKSKRVLRKCEKVALTYLPVKELMIQIKFA